MDSAVLIDRLFDVIEHDIVPLTREGVAVGNKIFGAAILRKADLSLVIAATNNETENPLWHGEVHALKLLYERERASLPDPGDCLFFATHEPCSLCISAITWGGYDNFYYLFSHEDSRDSFAIPHDIRIIREVFDTSGEPDRPLYNRQNAFWSSHSLPRMIASLDRGARERLLGRMDDIGALYADLSARYQQAKGGKGIPFA
jgi:tRNA(Arg) A34 adenosine deaminase TadA